MKILNVFFLLLFQFAFSQAKKMTRGTVSNSTNNNKITIGTRVGNGITITKVSNSVASRPAGSELFVVPTGGARTSAGVYNSTGTLVRTLWSGLSLTSGTYTIKWDGTDDRFNTLPAGDYTIKVLTNNVQYIWQGTLANSSQNQTGKNTIHRSLEPPHALEMAGSKVYYAVGYDEATPSHFIFDTSSPQLKSSPFLDYCNQTTDFVASDGTNMYWQGWDNYQQGHSWVYATKVSDNKEVTTFTSGTGRFKVTYGRTYRSTISHRDGNRTASFPYNGGEKLWRITEPLPWKFWKIMISYNGVARYDSVTKASEYNINGNTITTTHEIPSGATVSIWYWQVTNITGLAVSSNYLFVARENLNTIEVLNKKTGATISTLAGYSNIRAMTVDLPNNILWVCHDINVVEKYSINNSNGTIVSTGLKLTGLSEPCDMKIYKGNVVVVDGGTNNQVKAYRTDDGALQWTFGDKGGNLNSAVVTNTRFGFSIIDENTGLKKARGSIAFAQNGAMWIADPSNRRIMHYSSNREFISSIVYQGKTYSCFIDPNNHARLLTNLQEFAVNYDQPDIHKSWTYTYNWEGNFKPGYILFGGIKTPTTLSNGRTYGTMTRTSGATEIVELVATQGIRYTGITSTQGSVRMAANGDLYSVEATGINENEVWKKQTLMGFDGSNDPVYSLVTTILTNPVASDIYQPRLSGAHIRPWEVTSTNVLVSFRGNIDKDGNNKAIEPEGSYHLGGINPTTGAWLWKTSMSTPAGYTGEFPFDGAFDVGNGPPDYAGNVAVAIERSIIWGFNGEGWKQSEVNKWNHYYDDGLFIGQFGKTGPQYDADEVTNAAFAGNAFSPAIVKEGSDYYLYHNDESVHGGILRWKITGLNTIKEQRIAVNTSHSGNTRQVVFERDVPTKTVINLMEGLPFTASQLPNKSGVTSYSPTGNANFVVQTGVVSHRKRFDRDVTFQYSGGAGNATFNFDLGTNTSGAWTINGNYKREGLTVGNGVDFAQLQVLDGVGKIIAKLDYMTPSFGTSGFHIQCNGQDMLADYGDGVKTGRIVNNLQPLSITAKSSSGITFNYGPLTKTVSIADRTANWQNPKTLRIYCTGGGQKVSMQNFTFSK